MYLIKWSIKKSKHNGPDVKICIFPMICWCCCCCCSIQKCILIHLYWVVSTIHFFVYYDIICGVCVQWDYFVGNSRKMECEIGRTSTKRTEEINCIKCKILQRKRPRVGLAWVCFCCIVEYNSAIERGGGGKDKTAVQTESHLFEQCIPIHSFQIPIEFVCAYVCGSEQKIWKEWNIPIRP